MLAGMEIKMDDRGKNAAGIFDNQIHKRKARPLAEQLACMASKFACGIFSALPKKEMSQKYPQLPDPQVCVGTV